LDHSPELLGGAQDTFDALGFGLLLLQFLQDLLDLHLRNAVELRIEDGVGLDLVQLERLHELDRRVRLAVALSDQADGLVQVIKDNAEALQDVNAAPELLQFELKATTDGGQPEIQEVSEDNFEPQSFWPRRPVRGRH